MDAIDILLADHRKFGKMFAMISTGTMPQEIKAKMFFQLLHDLKMHEAMEEKEWYPYIMSKNNSLLKHLVHEEKEAGLAIKAFEKMQPFTDSWWKKFNKFKHDVLHHAHEEETNLFPAVSKHFSKPYLIQLGRSMIAFKQAHP